MKVKQEQSKTTLNKVYRPNIELQERLKYNCHRIVTHVLNGSFHWLIMFQVKGKDSGTKTLLLLHRSMAFILEFITGLKNSNSKTRSVDVAQQAFDKTMAQYYSWLVNKMASVAFNALPSTKVSMCICTKTSECVTRVV